MTLPVNVFTAPFLPFDVSHQRSGVLTIRTAASTAVDFPLGGSYDRLKCIPIYNEHGACEYLLVTTSGSVQRAYLLDLRSFPDIRSVDWSVVDSRVASVLLSGTGSHLALDFFPKVTQVRRIVRCGRYLWLCCMDRTFMPNYLLACCIDLDTLQMVADYVITENFRRAFSGRLVALIPFSDRLGCFVVACRPCLRGSHVFGYVLLDNAWYGMKTHHAPTRCLLACSAGDSICFMWHGGGGSLLVTVAFEELFEKNISKRPFTSVDLWDFLSYGEISRVSLPPVSRVYSPSVRDLCYYQSSDTITVVSVSLSSKRDFRLERATYYQINPSRGLMQTCCKFDAMAAEILDDVFCPFDRGVRFGNAHEQSAATSS